MKKIALLSLIFLFAFCSFAQGRRISGIEYYEERIPAPYLLSPIGGEVDLSDKDTLEFKWSPHEGASGFREYYDFRLYKGYSTVESTRILKQEVPSDNYQINLQSSLFEDGQIYTWTLRQVYSAGRKSDPSHASFRIKKVLKEDVKAAADTDTADTAG